MPTQAILALIAFGALLLLIEKAVSVVGAIASALVSPPLFPLALFVVVAAVVVWGVAYVWSQMQS